MLSLLTTREVSVVFNISSLHELLINQKMDVFTWTIFNIGICFNFTCLIKLTNTRISIPYIIIFRKNSNHLIAYTHIDIHHYSIFLLNCIYFHSIYIYTHKIHPKLKIMFALPSALNWILLHSYFHFISNKYSGI